MRSFETASCVDAGIRVHLQRAFQVEPVSPVRPNCNWQGKAEGGYSLDAFVVDGETQRVRCPQGHFSTSWRPNKTMLGGDSDRIQPFDLSTVSQPKRLHPLSQGIPASQRTN